MNFLTLIQKQMFFVWEKERFGCRINFPTRCKYFSFTLCRLLRVLIRTSERPLNPLIQLKFHLIHIIVGLVGALNDPALDQECFVGSERSACLFHFSSNLNDLFYLPLLGNPNAKVKTFYQLVNTIETKT